MRIGGVKDPALLNMRREGPFPWAGVGGAGVVWEESWWSSMKGSPLAEALQETSAEGRTDPDLPLFPCSSTRRWCCPRVLFFLRGPTPSGRAHFH